MTLLEKKLIRLDMTNKKLGERTGLHKSQVSRIVNGLRPTLSQAFGIAKALNCRIEDVFAAE